MTNPRLSMALTRNSVNCVNIYGELLPPKHKKLSVMKTSLPDSVQDIPCLVLSPGCMCIVRYALLISIIAIQQLGVMLLITVISLVCLNFLQVVNILQFILWPSGCLHPELGLDCPVLPFSTLPKSCTHWGWLVLSVSFLPFFPDTVPF